MKPTRALIAILIVLGFPLAQLLWADDDGDGYGELNIFDLIVGIIENPDPIPQVHYVNLTADPNDPGARTRGQRFDGRPVFEFDRITQDPYLAWAYDAGTDHDIAFNTWDGSGWDPNIEFLTSSMADEVDPRMYVDRYNQLYMTWWEDEPDSRMLFAKRETRGWGHPIDIGSGRRPSLAVWYGNLVVVYERDRPFGQEIVFAISHSGGPFVSEVVAVTSRTARLDPIVHVRSKSMWVDWKDSDNSIAFSQYHYGSWDAPMVRAWNDPSWLGELKTRYSVELELTD